MSDWIARRRKLLEDATPRPWKWDERTIRGKGRNAIFRPGGQRHPRQRLNHETDGDLIVQAVNDYEALLDVAETVRRIVLGVEDAWTRQHLTPEIITARLRAALARLEEQ